MKIGTTGNIEFITRVGKVEYAGPYAKAGVKTYSDGSVSLTILKDYNKPNVWYSAGLMGPQVEKGIYEFEFNVRADAMDPAVDLGFYFHNENGIELDMLEISRWANPSESNLYWHTLYRGEGDMDARSKWVGGAYVKYKLTASINTTCNIGLDAVKVNLDGTEEWVNVTWASFPMDNVPGGWQSLGQLRVVLFVPNNTGFTYKNNASARGPLTVMITSAKFTSSI